MIKLLPFLLLFSLAEGRNINYLLPEHNPLFSHTLEGVLKRSRMEILIITPAFNHAVFKRAALEGIKRGSHLILIVQTLEGDPLAMAQYERSDVHTLEGRPLEGSMVLVDNRFACDIPGRIDQESFSGHASLIQCSDDPAEVANFRAALAPLLKRSKPYLK